MSSGTYTLLQIDALKATKREVTSGGYDKVMDHARTLKADLEAEGSLDTLLIRNPDGHEEPYDGAIGAVHAT